MSGKCAGWAFDQKTGSPITKLVLVKLADNASNDGFCCVKFSTIVDGTELSERAVREHLLALEKMGLMTIIRRYGEGGVRLPSHFQLHVPWAEPKTHPGAPNVQEVHSHGAPGAGGGGAPGAQQYNGSKSNGLRNNASSSNPVAPLGKGKDGAKAKTLIGDYTPSQEARQRAAQYWEKRGRADLVQTIDDVVFHFVSHHRGKGTRMVEWEQVWQTWYCNQIFTTRAPPPPRAGQPSSSASVIFEQTSVQGWIYRLESFFGLNPEVKKGFWLPKYGPPPNSPDCKAPDEAFEKIHRRKTG